MKRTITKEVEAVVCEFCDKEIDTNSDNYGYGHIRSSGTVINSHHHGVTHMLFAWYRKVKDGLSEKDEKNEYVQYDFHASCFDKLMIKFLKEKKAKPKKSLVSG